MMTGIKRWFTTRTPAVEDPWWDGHLPWFNHYYEHSGTRIRFLAGDLLAEMEHEGGSPGGLQFGIELHLCQEDTPEFYLQDKPNAKYDTHWFSAIFWRWGIHFSIRGRLR